MTPEAFKLNSKMLAANPDFYSMWNHRREMLGPMMHGKCVVAPYRAAGDGAVVCGWCLA